MTKDLRALAMASSFLARPRHALAGDLPVREVVEDSWASLSTEAQELAMTDAHDLYRRDVGVLTRGDDHYPARLLTLAEPPPVLFYAGSLHMLEEAAVGMCGSRSASPEGLAAARACGEEAARRGLVVVSGHAKGVDTETHLGALELGGKTIAVLAEGFLRFRLKRALRDASDPSRLLVLSQFAPRQTWNVGAAMTRNAVIAALGLALVVVEAGATGGTLDAGLAALRLGRPVLALEFAGGSPPGNEILFDRGALRIRTRRDLVAAVHAVRDLPARNSQGQLRLPIE